MQGMTLQIHWNNDGGGRFCAGLLDFHFVVASGGWVAMSAPARVRSSFIITSRILPLSAC